MIKGHQHTCLAVLAAASMLLPAQVLALDYSWNSTSQVNFTAGPWSPVGTPTASDSIITPTQFGNMLVSNVSVTNFTYNSASNWDVIGNLATSSLTISGNLSKDGAGSLTIRTGSSKPINLTVGGAVTVAAGTLALTGLTGLSAGSMTISGGNVTLSAFSTSNTTAITGALTMSGNTTLNIRNTGIGGTLSVGSLVSASSNATVQVNSNSSLAATATLELQNASGSATFAGVVKNSGGAAANVMNITKVGAGTQVFSGNNTYTGVTTISAGTLSVGTIGNGGVAGNLGNAASAAANLVFDGGTLQYTGSNSTSNRAFTINADKSATIDTTNNLSFVGATGSATTGGLTKTGVGTLTLTGANTYTGLTTVTGGALTIGSSGSLAGTSTLAIGASGTADFANAGQTLGAVTNANTASNALNFSAATGTVTLANLGGSGNTRFGSNGAITGGISGGTVTSVGALNSDISGGTVTVGGVATISTMSAGTANLNGATSAITTLNGGAINLGTSALTVNAGNSAEVIAGAGGSLIKSGSGTLTLSGTNTYGGATTIGNGTLNLTGTGSINGSSGITLNGGTLKNNSSINLTAPLTFTSGTLGGTNLSGVTLSIGTNQFLAPGNSAGTISAGATTFADGGTFEFEINNATGTAGSTSGWDLLNPTSLSITATAGQFNLKLISLASSQVAGFADNFTSATNYSWLFVDSGSVISSFTGSQFSIDTTLFQNSNMGTFSVVRGETIGGGDDTQLYLAYTAAIPEPSTYVTIAGVALLAFAAMRRRR